ncbi:tRNA pseudouridine synthase A [Klebsiella pneumoniae]|uniref:tRNA pseudouridine synthase A n=1 Tax=Klebsiella pneumoniae TaxID=573 RepID=A0A2X3EZS1_KLEPN|nr:tRNA pseudouridine synthase A [Klebsiella pneumoniae]
MHINVTRYGAYVVVDIKANAFVHHMVRILYGSLMEVGPETSRRAGWQNCWQQKTGRSLRQRQKRKGCIWCRWITRPL